MNAERDYLTPKWNYQASLKNQTFWDLTQNGSAALWPNSLTHCSSLFPVSKTDIYVWSLSGTNCRKLLHGNRIPHSSPSISLQNTCSNYPPAPQSLGTTCSWFSLRNKPPNPGRDCVLGPHKHYRCSEISLLTVINKDWEDSLQQPGGWRNFKPYPVYVGNQKRLQLPDSASPLLIFRLCAASWTKV